MLTRPPLCPVLKCPTPRPSAPYTWHLESAHGCCKGLLPPWLLVLSLLRLASLLDPVEPQGSLFLLSFCVALVVPLVGIVVCSWSTQTFHWTDKTSKSYSQQCIHVSPEWLHSSPRQYFSSIRQRGALLCFGLAAALCLCSAVLTQLFPETCISGRGLDSSSSSEIASLSMVLGKMVLEGTGTGTLSVCALYPGENTRHLVSDVCFHLCRRVVRSYLDRTGPKINLSDS